MNALLLVASTCVPTAAAGVSALLVALRNAAAKRISEQRRYSLLESIPDAFFILDDELRFTHVNERAEELLRTTALELVGRRVVELFDPLASELVPEIRRARDRGEPLQRVQFFAATNQWIEIRVQPADGEVLVYLRNVTETKTSESRVSGNERRLHLLLSQVPAVIWAVDLDMRVTSVAGAGTGERGRFEESLVGMPFDALLSEHDEKDACRAAVARAFGGETVRYETRHGDRWMQNDVEPLRNPQGDVVGAIGVMLDVTDMRENAERFSQLARRDALTGFPNRMCLNERLPELMAQADARQESLAVLFIDVDRFKTINDTLGHRAGDQLLQSVAHRLQQSLGDRALIFRPGGDEFVAVVSGLTPSDNVHALASAVVGVFDEPFRIAGREAFVTGSVGGCTYPHDGKTAEDLIMFADQAMYSSKGAGGNTARLFDAAARARVVDRMTLEQDLRASLAGNEMQLVYQPVVDVRRNVVVGAEALIRWRHPVRGELLPEAFISIAEETGFIAELSSWVVREACRSAVRIRETEDPDFRIAVNISPKELYDPDFAVRLCSIVAETGLSAHALDIEITESVLIDEIGALTLERVRAQGIGVMLDDFGTGYSSLSYLKRMPITALKIDRAFIEDVASDSNDQGIVKAIVAIGQTLGLKIVAEGIESQLQYAFMQGHCNFAQGHFFCRPVSYGDLVERLRCMSGAQASRRIIPLHTA